MKTFDLTSDIHIDFWVDATNNAQKQKKNFRTLINKLLPSNPSDTLVIAGDLGHYNHQNKLFLITLREFYKNIILVHGNHDLYMISASIRKSFLYNSFNRLDNS
jgi:metallophosphoesterase superfamily enzyme